MPTQNVRLIFSPSSIRDDRLWPKGTLAFILEQVTGGVRPPFAQPLEDFSAWERTLKDYFRDRINVAPWILDIQMVDDAFVAGEVIYSREWRERWDTPPRENSVTFNITTPEDYDDFLDSNYVGFSDFHDWARFKEGFFPGFAHSRKAQQPFNPVPPKKLGRRNLKPVPLP